MDRATVLIVAANPFHLSLMSDLLEANDVRTVRAKSAAEALTTAKERAPTMVVMDLDLPGEESRKIVDGLKKREETRSVPVMAVADRSQREMFAQILECCESGSVEKPIDTGVFPRRVLQEIRRHTTGLSREALL
jgi:CheY-like chemotaxis protein